MRRASWRKVSIAAGVRAEVEVIGAWAPGFAVASARAMHVATAIPRVRRKGGLPMKLVSTSESSESMTVLDPMERSMEALFGLIMVLTFTGSLSVLGAGHAEVREMLIGALGCNL